MPFLLVVAGPNGSGKTTLTRHLQSRAIDFGVYINPDDIVLELGLDPASEAGSRTAQIEADRRRADCIERRLGFSFETVMSHPSKVDVMRQASAVGYDVTLFFVATSDPRINVSRVENRVAKGGHAVPPDRIVNRYGRSLSLLADAVVASDRSVIFDNSALPDAGAPSARATTRGSGLRVVAEVRRSLETIAIELDPLLPEWVDRYLVAELNERVASGSGLRVTIEHRTQPF